METIKLFFKGIIIGIGKIIPGVSGSMLAISLGIYEKLLKRKGKNPNNNRIQGYDYLLQKRRFT